MEAGAAAGLEMEEEGRMGVTTGVYTVEETGVYVVGETGVTKGV